MYRQASVYGHNFYLIHALQIQPDDVSIREENYIYLLISTDKIDMAKYFDKNSFIKSKILMNIYPPWYNFHDFPIL